MKRNNTKPIPAERLVSLLTERNLTVFTAESCTGGLIAKKLTDVPGASRAVNGGIVSYTNEIKSGVLGVDPQTISEHTAVSREVALEMAECAAKHGDIGVSVTGYAGGNPSSDPVGLVFIGVSHGGKTEAFRHDFEGDRHEIREKAADAAILHVIDAISEN
ncbi:MAG: CinA family protein [Clostridia bacterium]|nr:CinA family protein [Clostridia bacterium]